MEYQETKLKGVVQISLPIFADDRGFFKEVLRVEKIEEIIGAKFTVKQMNHSRSAQHTLRGIHAAPWNKLIYVARGMVRSVIVDLRSQSPTFKQYVSFDIGEENKSAIFVPSGCGNSYLVLSDEADYTYLTDEVWAPNKEVGVLYNDPELGIDWQLKGEPLLSEKDKVNPLLKNAF